MPSRRLARHRRPSPRLPGAGAALALAALLAPAVAAAQRASDDDPGTVPPITALIGAHAGVLGGKPSLFASLGVRFHTPRVRLDLLPLDLSIRPEASPGYSVGFTGECTEQATGRQVNGFGCGIEGRYGAAAEVSVVLNPGVPRALTLGAGVRGGARGSVYATAAFDVGPRAAPWFAVATRLGPNLVSVGVNLVGRR